MTIRDFSPIAEPQLAQFASGTLSYRAAGKGTPLYFLHGLNGNSRSWSEQFAAFSERYHVIAWDAPGYGHSDCVEPDIDAYADAAAELLSAVAVGPAIVVGHSMGGVVAGRLAYRHPNKVTKLILSCTHSGNAQPKDRPLASKFTNRIKELNAMPPSDYGRLRASKMVPGDTPAEVANIIAEIAAEARPEGLKGAGLAINTADNSPLLKQLTLPVLIIDADKDPVIKPGQLAQLAEMCPKAYKVTLKGLGHAPYLEDPGAYNKILKDFLDV